MSDKLTEILKERGTQHGDFSDQAVCSQRLKEVMRSYPNWDGLSSVQKEGLEMVQHKVARILCGDPNHKDHWDDGAGYFTIVSMRLPIKTTRI